MSEPKPVPFVGWSLAAMNFRQQMRQRAAAGVSLLLVGEPGTGKKEMAEAWRQASGAGKVPIVDLDEPSATIPKRCVAVTTRPVRSKIEELQPLDLTSLRPVSDCQLDGKKIPASILSQFAIKFLVPPLRQRQMDILAAVYCLGGLLPTGNRTICISSRLIYRMFLDAVWIGNLRTLIDHLHMAVLSAARRAEEDSSAAKGKDNSSAVKRTEGPPKVVIRDHDMGLRGPINPDDPGLFPHQLLPAIRPGRGARSLGMKPRLWMCDDKDIPIGRLPLVAVSIFFDAFGKTFQELDDDPSPAYVLGNDSRWLREPRLQGLTLATLGSAPARELLQRWNLGAEPDQGDIAQVERLQVYGASLESLQDGFRETVATPIPSGETDKPKVTKRRRGQATEERLAKYRKVIAAKDLRDLTWPEIAIEMSLGSRQAAKQLYQRATKYFSKYKPDQDEEPVS